MVPVLFRTVATGLMWLLSTQNVARVAEELNFTFYLINLNNHMWLITTILDSTGLD